MRRRGESGRSSRLWIEVVGSGAECVRAGGSGQTWWVLEVGR